MFCLVPIPCSMAIPVAARGCPSSALQVVLGGWRRGPPATPFREPAAIPQPQAVRAKARIRDSGVPLAVSSTDGKCRPAIESVLDAIYAAFGQGVGQLDTPEARMALTERRSGSRGDRWSRCRRSRAKWSPGAELLLQRTSPGAPGRGRAALCPHRRQDARLWDRTPG